MRYREIIFEYVREKTIENYGDAIFKRLRSDNSASFVSTWISNALRRKEKDMSVTDWVRMKSLDSFFRSCEYADPTSTHSYVQWIVSRYLKGGIKRFEDIESTCADYLDQYDEIKKSGFFKRTTDPVLKPLSDINRLKSLFELKAVLNSIPADQRISNSAADKKKEEELIVSGAVTVLVNTDTCLEIIPRTEEAAVYFGRNTQWCTSAKRNNMFRLYNLNGDLFIVLDKKNNRRWQFHPSTAQFMDENDENMTDREWALVPQEALNINFYEDSIEVASEDDLRTMDAKGIYPFSTLAGAALQRRYDEELD